MCKLNVAFILVLLFASTAKINGGVNERPLETPEEACRYSNLGLPVPPSVSKLHRLERGAVCSDTYECSKIGSDIFEAGGNVVDATIATMLCSGIATAQSMGIGGGFLMNIWFQDKKKSVTLNAKEVAPLAATKDMFKTTEEFNDGPLTISVPGEIKGYWELHKKYGSMPWKKLVEPSIRVCENGFKLTQHMSEYIVLRLIKDSPLRNSFFINGTNIPHRPGDIIYMPNELCNTYKMLSENGGDDFYTGTLADLIAQDLKDLGSIITKKDLQSYEVNWEESLSLPITNDETVHVTPSAGGPTLAFILNILRGYNFSSNSVENDDQRIRTYHRIIEAFKFAFGYRTQMNNSLSTDMPLIHRMLSPDFTKEIRQKIDDNHTTNDPKYYGGQFDVNNDKGTAHISVLAPNGDAISVTTSINFYFGIGEAGKRTGIIFNTAMSDFSAPGLKNLAGLPASVGNYIAPQKQPQSAMSPAIVTDTNGKVRLVVGAAGGTKIPTSVSMVIARYIWFQQNIKEAVDAPRIHHQLIPMEVQYECGNAQKLIAGLELYGHKTNLYHGRGSVVCAIAQTFTEPSQATGQVLGLAKGGQIFANADFRKAGHIVGF